MTTRVSGLAPLHLCHQAVLCCQFFFYPQLFLLILSLAHGPSYCCSANAPYFFRYSHSLFVSWCQSVSASHLCDLSLSWHLISFSIRYTDSLCLSLTFTVSHDALPVAIIFFSCSIALTLYYYTLSISLSLFLCLSLVLVYSLSLSRSLHIFCLPPLSLM